MSLSEALKEAYASGDEDGVVLTTAEIDHASFDEPIRVVTGIDGPTGDPDYVVMLPVRVGNAFVKVAHKPCAFSFIRPGHDTDGPTDARVAIDNVSDLLVEHLEAALGFNMPITITFRQYVVQPGQIGAVTEPDEEIAGMLLDEVEVGANRTEGSLSWPDGRRANVPTGPNGFFDRENYPALYA